MVAKGNVNCVLTPLVSATAPVDFGLRLSPCRYRLLATGYLGPAVQPPSSGSVSVSDADPVRPDHLSVRPRSGLIYTHVVVTET